MASLFQLPSPSIHLLDAGAGHGALTSALVRRICREPGKVDKISVTAYEIDLAIVSSLHSALSTCRAECEKIGIGFSATVHNTDFIEAVVPAVRRDLFAPPLPRFNTTILNPPYRKIRGDSAARLLLRSAGIETSNLYTGFLALVVRLLSPEGEMVAITWSQRSGIAHPPLADRGTAEMQLRRMMLSTWQSASGLYPSVPLGGVR